MNATAQYETIKQHAETIRNDQTHDLRQTMEVGDSWAQGDILIRKIEGVPDGSVVASSPDRQLAPGNTQGSRHCLSTLSGVTVHTIPDANALEGPVFTVDDEVTVEHPEHGDVVLGPGCYAITYQRAYADELRRVAD